MIDLARYSFALSAKWTAVCGLVGLMTGISVALLPAAIGAVAENLITRGSFDALTLVAVIALVAVQVILSPLRAFAVTRMNGLTARDQAVRLGSSGTEKPRIDEVEDPAFRSALSLARSHAHYLDFGLLFAWTGFVPAITSLLSMTVVLSILGLSVVAGILFVVVVVDAWWVIRQTTGESDRWSDEADASSRADYMADLALDPRAAKELRTFSLFGFIRRIYDESITSVHRTASRERFTRFGRVSLGLVVRLAVTVGVLAVLTSLATSGRLPVPELASVLPLVLVFSTLDISPVRQIAQAGSALRLLDATSSIPVQSLERLPAQWPVRPDRSPAAAVRPARTRPPSVELREVTFRYPGASEDVFAGLSLRLEAGSSNALVASNGTGKSTLLKVIAGAYAPTDGQILIDGDDTTRWTARDWSEWQAMLAIVTQDVPRLPVSAGDYVELGAGRLWDGDVSERGSLERAASRAGIADLVGRMRERWATPVSSSVPGGTDLSGGEWQRLALAQALRGLDDGGSVLLLDEPAAALDVEAESRLIRDYVGMVDGTTSLVISHRFSVVRPIPHIHVMTREGIAEHGSHSDLMRRDGLYAGMFRIQSAQWRDR